MSFTNWGGAPNLPDDMHGPQSENCMHMWQDQGQWNDIGCNSLSEPQDTMCEKLVACV